MRVLIAEDHPMFRVGLAALLEARPGVDSVVTAETGNAAMAAVEDSPPDVAVVDLRMPDGDGVWLIRQLRALHPAVRVLVLTSIDDDGAVTDALAAGANGYLLKTAGPDEIAEAVTAIGAGASVLSDAGLKALSPRGGTDPFPHLSDREFEVLAALAAGRSTDSIGRLLGLSPKTVRNHVSSILLKLQVENRAAAVVAAHRAGVGVS